MPLFLLHIKAIREFGKFEALYDNVMENLEASNARHVDVIKALKQKPQLLPVCSYNIPSFR